MNKKLSTLIVVAIIAVAILATVFSVSKRQHEVVPAKLQVAAILPLTGPAAVFGQDEKLGIELALQTQKDAKIPLSFIFEDSQGKPDLGVSSLRKNYDIAGTRIFFVSTTGPAMAILPILKESAHSNIAFVIATVSGVTREFPSALRIYPSVDEEIRILGGYAEAKGYKRIAAYTLNNQAGEEAIRKMGQKVTAYGGSVVFSDTFTPTEKDFRQVLLKVKQSSADALLITGYTSQYADIFRQMIENDIKIPVLAGIGVALGGLEKEFPAEFMANVVFPASRFNFERNNARIHEFEAMVKAKGKVANFEIAYAYDSTQLLRTAVDRAQSTDPKKIFDAILSLMPYDGINGTTKFDEHRDAILDLKACRYGPNGIEPVLR